MKKAIITCLLVVAAMLPAILSAQPASWSGHLYTPTAQEDDAVVRKWNDGFVIAAYRHADTQFLAAVHIGNFMDNTPGETLCGLVLGPCLHPVGLQ